MYDKFRLISFFTLAVCCSSIALAAPPPGTLPTQPVEVVNTPAVDIANQPTVNIGNTPAVDIANQPTVNIGNVPAVDIANTPTVNIANTPLPVTVENGGNDAVVRIPFQYEASADNWTGRVNFPISLTSLGFSTADTLVVEHVSARLIISPESQLQFFTATTLAGPLAPVTHEIALVPSYSSDSNGNKIYTISQPLRLYTEGHFGVALSLIKSPPLCDGFPDKCDARIAVSGYVIPTGTASLGP